eukprot:TRINITY_DN3757_c0_g2_i15.p1 TRINITY_DN3757_c0_g2~~TRINITY_DN3757_c0_g2_i15.p1  ORF type:complete len:235 (+),score=34.32 TRINITY_DN3757_c0_g2_i15:208-912(+)
MAPLTHFSLGAMLGAIVTSPLEVVKIRLQAHRYKESLQSNFNWGLGPFRSLRALWCEEGLLGLYRGLGTHCAGVIPARSLHFLVYGNMKNFLESRFPANYRDYFPIVASGLAGATVVTLLQPLWFIKTRLQLQTIQSTSTSYKLYSGFWDVYLKTVKLEGYSALYKGLSASYLGLTETIIQFTLYEKLKSCKLEDKKKREKSPVLSISETLFFQLFLNSLLPQQPTLTRLFVRD